MYRDWSVEPAVIHAGDCPIVPNATYEVQAILVGANAADEDDYSEPLTLPTTDVWGDVVGPPDEGVSTPPDGTAGPDDVMAALAYFQGSPTAPPMPWVDVSPEVPNAVINVGDIMGIIGAFQGESYPFSAPESCP